MSTESNKTQGTHAPEKRYTAIRMLAISVLMFGFGFALVPLYSIICEVTGLNGKTGTAENNISAPDPNRTITVQFTSSVSLGSPFEFAPKTTQMVVHPGGIYSTSYTAHNLSHTATVAQATPSVSPSQASLYFNKIECFCFTRQAFTGGEEKEMPVQFVIDRDIPAHVKNIVLSYTFFELPEQTGS